MNSTDALFKPIQIGSVTLKNRVIMTAMGGTSPFEESAEGYQFKPEIRDYYMDRVKGGVALIIPGATNVWDCVGDRWLHERVRTCQVHDPPQNSRCGRQCRGEYPLISRFAPCLCIPDRTGTVLQCQHRQSDRPRLLLPPSA